MSINGPEDLAGMRAAGAIVRRMLEAMKRLCVPASPLPNWMQSAPRSCASTERNPRRNWSTNFPE